MPPPLPFSRGVSLFKIIRSWDHAEEGISYDPEVYSAAGGELLVVAMVVSWSLTLIFNPDVIDKNPLKDRVGYNNLCVGWDTVPSLYVAAPLFALIIFIELRFLQLGLWRASLDTSCKGWRKVVVHVSHGINAISWLLSIGIFSINAFTWPLGHTLSFVQLAVGTYISYIGNFLETDSSRHPHFSWIFCGLYGVIALGFGVCALTQMVMYDEITQQRGPVPMHVMAALDYSYFGCMTLQGFFRPHAPSVRATYRVVSDDDYTLQESPTPIGQSAVPGAQDFSSLEQGVQQPSLSCCGGGRIS